MTEPLAIGFNVEFDEAIKIAKKRKVVLPDVYYGELKGAARAKAFSIAGLASIEQLKAVKKTMDDAIASGKSFDQWKKAALEVNDFSLPKHRLDNIFRTNLQSSYMAGRWTQFQINKKYRPYLMYDAINDSRVRLSHLALDNVIRKVDDPFWKTHSPLNGYRCRCSLISLSEAQAKARSGKGKGLNNLGQLDDGSPAQPDKGWEYNPKQRLAGVKKAKTEAIQENPKVEEPLQDFAATPINNWKKTGGQKGSNEGGTYLADDGVEWYVKFPAEKSRAYNEVLAGKLYEAAGVDVPEMMIIRQEGRIGLASRIIIGLENSSKRLMDGSVTGIHEGFAVDAWLANWDVVGLGYDNMLIKGSKAVRVDTGGALLYRAQGAEKGAAFGKNVTELKTLRDAAKNSNTAAVFGSITEGQIKASAAKVLSIDDAIIKDLVEQYGPGDSIQKAALSDLLIARKASILSQFPDVPGKMAQAVTQAIDAEKALLKDKLSMLDASLLETIKGINYRAKSGGVIDAKDLARAEVAKAKYQQFIESATYLNSESLQKAKDHYADWLLKVDRAIIDGEGSKALAIDGIFEGFGSSSLKLNERLIKPRFEAWMFGDEASFSGKRVLEILDALERDLKVKQYLTMAEVPTGPGSQLFDKMPEEYKRALWSWTPSHVYRDVSRRLLDRAYKGVTPSQAILDYEKLVNTALKAAPEETRHKGESTRGMFDDKTDALEYFERMVSLEKSGGVYQFETISSSTRGSKPAFNKHVHVHITGKTGIHIKPISNHKGEDEVLFGTEHKFKVKKNIIISGVYHVYLEEIQ